MEENRKKLGFGMMRLPITNPDDKTSIDEAQVCRMVDQFLDQGFTYFDTAYMYHSYASEHAVRKALVERWPRERFLLADKLPVSHLKQEEDMERIFLEQLKKCGVTYFDYYLLHNISRISYETVKRLDAFSFLRKKKEEGKIRRLGFSFHADAELLEEILKEHPEVEFVQIQLNYIDWESPYIQSRRCYEVCRAYGKEVVVMEPVKGGMLAAVPDKARAAMEQARPGSSAASWAIRFAASLEGVIMVLSGMSNEEQLSDNLSYMREFEPLTEKEYKVLHQATNQINASMAVGCTGCRYCVEGCPKKLAIPEYFALYNRHHQFGDKSNAMAYYPGYASNHGKAEDCVGCGACERSCPQHLPIIRLMKEVSAVFDR